MRSAASCSASRMAWMPGATTVGVWVAGGRGVLLMDDVEDDVEVSVWCGMPFINGYMVLMNI